MASLKKTYKNPIRRTSKDKAPVDRVFIFQRIYRPTVFALSRFSQRKKPIFRQIPTAVDTGAARPILVRLAFGWILI